MGRKTKAAMRIKRMRKIQKLGLGVIEFDKAEVEINRRERKSAVIRALREKACFRENEKLVDRAMKAKRRANTSYRILEKEADKKQKQKKRAVSVDKRNVEREADREAKRIRRVNFEIKAIVREKERLTKKVRRTDRQLRETEKAKDRLAKRYKRADGVVRSVEREREMLAKRGKRADEEVMAFVREKEMLAKRGKRADEDIRAVERERDKLAKQGKRANEEVRRVERERDKLAKQGKRADENLREIEKEKNRTAKRCRRADEELRVKEREKDRTLKQKRRSADNEGHDSEYRKLERQREALRKKRLRLEELYSFRESYLRTLRAHMGTRSSAAKSAKLIYDLFLKRKEGPDSVCTCCDNLFFKISVVNFEIEKIRNRYCGPLKFEDFISKICNVQSNFICRTCYKSIIKGNIPKLAISQNLKFPDVPQSLKNLSPLEERMCAPYIPFMQILPLQPHAVNPQLSLKGSVVNIPVNVKSMTNVLPRRFSDMSTIQITLKRDLAHSSYYMAETIRPAAVCEALKYLINTPLYQENGVTVDPDFFASYEHDFETQVDFIVPGQDTLIENDKTINQENGSNELITVNDIEDGDDDQLIIREANNEVMIVDRNQQTALEGHLAIIAPGQGQSPVSWYNVPFIDELSFPKIFAGFPLDREKKLSYTQRVKSECRRSDRRSCIANRVLFMAKQKLERCVISSVNICLRKMRANSKVNAGLASSSEFIDDAVRFDDGFRILKQVRYSPAYLEAKKHHLMAMFRQLGYPSFFLTMSTTEIKNPELLSILYKLANGRQISLEEAMYMDLSEKTKLIRDDPVTVVRYTENMFNLIMELLENANGPLGEHFATDHFQRREFQGRGSVHTHNLIYCNNAPKYDVENPESVRSCIKFIDRFMTCRYDPTNPNMAFQRHKHTPTCYKGRKQMKICRFQCPWPVMPETMILLPLDATQKTKNVKTNFDKIKNKMASFFVTNIHQSFQDILLEMDMSREDYINALRSSLKRPKVFLVRSSLEVAINVYNETILNLLGSNMDLQFVLDPYSCASYTLNYVTKIDDGLSKLLKLAANDIQDGNMSLKEKFKRIGNVFINGHVMGAQEAAYHVLGLPLVSSTRAGIYINSSPISERTRMLKSKADLLKLPVDSEDIYRTNIFEKYARRKNKLEQICLADYAAKYSDSKKTLNFNDDENDDLEQNFKPRKKDKILKFRRYKLEQEPTEYYREQILLFFPWRNELIEIENVDVAFKYQNNIGKIEENRKKYCLVGEEEIEIAISEAHDEQIDNEEVEEFNCVNNYMDVDIFPLSNQGNNNKSIEKVNRCFPKPLHISDEELFKIILKLNTRQRQLLMYIYNSIKTDKPPLRVYISGSAGVGKSSLINAINNLISKYFENKIGPRNDLVKILITAPSGKAAFNINGTTLHSAFALPVSQYGGTMPTLSADIANTIRSQLFEMKLLIIDEISMVGSRMLQRVDTRLRQIMGKEESFGGVSVILVGDLNQLPPVLDSPIYMAPRNNELSVLSGNILWEEFKCFELIEIMRQRDDAEFIVALNNLATGTMSDFDVALIKSREVQPTDVPVEAIRLFSTNAAVDQYNKKKIEENPNKGFLCTARDHIHGQITDHSKKKLRSLLLNKKTSETGGLPAQILFKVGIKYMMTSNINVQDGLVNGACGILVHIEYNHTTEQVDKVWLDFNSVSVGAKARQCSPPSSFLPITATPIRTTTAPVTVAQKMNCQIIREQYPLVAAEAITIHKSQGQTYDVACIDLRDKSRFSRKRAILYVALSRVTSLKNLYILGHFIPPKKPSSSDPLTIELGLLKTSKRLKLPFECQSNSSLIYHNVRSFTAHAKHIIADNWYFQACVIVFSESATMSSDTIEIPNYICLFRSDSNFKTRGPRGLIVFVKIGLKITLISSFQMTDDRKHIDLVAFTYAEHNIIAGYRSPTTPLSIFYSYLKKIVSSFPFSSKLIVIGDYNFDCYSGSGSFINIMENMFGLTPLLKPGVPTTDHNTQIDVVFTKNTNSISYLVYDSYFSDHKPLLLNLETSSTEITKINDQSTVYKPNGMVNEVGTNNCYNNSVLQALFSLGQFRNLLQTSQSSLIIEALQNVLLTPPPAPTFPIRTIISSSVVDFASLNQQDAEEYLTALLDTIPYCGSTLFKIATKSTIYCSGCSYIYSETMCDSHIARGCFPAHCGHSIEFINLFSESKTDLHCPICKSLFLVERTDIKGNSDCLIIQLLRYRFKNNRASKVECTINNFDPNNINIFGARYKCNAVITHEGPTVSYGHYTATVRCHDGSWMLCDDESVCSVEFDKTLRNAYLLFLIKV